MSFYVIGITGSVKSARHSARSWGVSLYDVEPICNLDANGDARVVRARAALSYGEKLDRWYRHSGARIKEIDAATPEAIAYLRTLSPEKRLTLEEKLFDATGNWQSGLLLIYQPVIDTPVRTYAWLVVKKLGRLALGLAGSKSSEVGSSAPTTAASGSRSDPRA